jgi:hypothetical protein
VPPAIRRNKKKMMNALPRPLVTGSGVFGAGGAAGAAGADVGTCCDGGVLVVLMA